MYQGYEKHQLRQITERISIEPLLTKHATPLLAAVNKSREHLSQYLPWTDWVTNRREAVAYISQRINSNAFEAYWFAIRLDQNFVGVLGMKGVNQETGVAEVGYCLPNRGVVIALLITFYLFYCHWFVSEGRQVRFNSIVWKAMFRASRLQSEQGRY